MTIIEFVIMFKS